jgi:hypothetical protein
MDKILSLTTLLNYNYKLHFFNPHSPKILCFGVNEMIWHQMKIRLRIIFKTHSQSLSLFQTCLRHLPSVMRIRSLEDLCQLTPLQIEAIPLDHYKVRQDITKLGSFLELKEAIFGSQSLEKVIQRLLKELSLPATILSVLKKCCQVRFFSCP